MFTLREDQQPYDLHAALRIKRSNIKCCGVTGGTPASQPAGRIIPLAALSYRYRDKHQQIWISPIASKSYLYCRPKSYFSCLQLMKNVRPTAERFEFSDRSVILYVSEVFEVTHSFAMLTCYQIFCKSARSWKATLKSASCDVFQKSLWVVKLCNRSKFIYWNILINVALV